MLVECAGAYVYEEVGDSLGHGLDFGTTKVSVLPCHRRVGDRLLVDVVVRGWIGLRLCQVQADRLLMMAAEQVRWGFVSIGAALVECQPLLCLASDHVPAVQQRMMMEVSDAGVLALHF